MRSMLLAGQKGWQLTVIAGLSAAILFTGIADARPGGTSSGSNSGQETTVADDPAAVDGAESGTSASIPDNAELRDTEADAYARAVETGVPVEVGVFRDERREVYMNPDGTSLAVEHTEPVRTIQDDQWVPIDTTLVTDADGTIHPKATVVDLTVSSGGSGSMAEVHQAGRSIGVKWINSLPSPVLSGDTATYPNVLPDVDLKVRAEVDGFSHLLVVKTAEAAADPALTQIDLPVDMSGVELQKDTEGGVAVVDTVTGGKVLESPNPLMWDSSTDDSAAASAEAEPSGSSPEGSLNTAEVDVTVDDNSMTLRPDAAMLSNPDAVFPIYIDPIMGKPAERAAWTMVDDGFQDGKWKFRGDQGLGACPVEDWTCQASKIRRLYFEMPTKQYAGKTIISAEFGLTLTHTWAYEPGSDTVDLYRTNGISKSTRWSNQPSGSQVENQSIPDNPDRSEKTCGQKKPNMYFDVRPEIADAADAGDSRVTFGMRNATESDSHKWMRFCNNATLYVKYNTKPDLPDTDYMHSNPGGACKYGEDAPFVDKMPRLRAKLTDPDKVDGYREKLTAEFKINWTQSGVEKEKVVTDPDPQASGSNTFEAQIDPAWGIPENVAVYWQVRGSDGQAWGPWSSSGSQTRCQFTYDKTAPASPTVSSADYPDDDAWHAGVGDYGTFTFDSASSDVTEYWYGVDTNPSDANVLKPEVTGGPVTLTWLPDEPGPHFITVKAKDRAAKASTIATYVFLVGSGRAGASEWTMADDVASQEAADSQGGSPAIVGGSDVEFGVTGPGGGADTAVRLTGNSNSYLMTHTGGLIDTTANFSVSAWVKLNDLDRNYAAVSQSGVNGSGFVLGYDSKTKQWAFEMAESDLAGAATNAVLGGSAKTGEWTHLVVSRDAQTGTTSLYVNGYFKQAVQYQVAWGSYGPIQIGRSLSSGIYTESWSGDLADIAVYDRVVVAGEVPKLSTLVPRRQGYWPLNSAPGGKAPEVGGGAGMSLTNGAQIYDPPPGRYEPPLVGEGHMVLDGINDYAASSDSFIATNESFTIATRVKLAVAAPGRSMTVLSIPGTNQSGLIVRYSAQHNRWELELPHSDVSGSPTTELVYADAVPSTDKSGQHIAVTYNSVLGEVQLYVNGQLLTTSATSYIPQWDAVGGLQVGRALVNGLWTEYFAGAVDDVRVYTGVADTTFIQKMASRQEQDWL